MVKYGNVREDGQERSGGVVAGHGRRGEVGCSWSGTRVVIETGKGEEGEGRGEEKDSLEGETEESLEGETAEWRIGGGEEAEEEE